MGRENKSTRKKESIYIAISESNTGNDTVVIRYIAICVGNMGNDIADTDCLVM